MTRVAEVCRKLFADSHGASVVEYALLLLFLSVALFAAMTAIGESFITFVDRLVNELSRLAT